MKRRKRMKVLGQWVTIDHCDLKNEELWGDCDVGKRIIRIKDDATDEEYQRVLRHEVCHMRLGISGLSEFLTPELEEALAVLAETV